MQGKYEQATQLYQESLALCREVGDRWILGMVLSNLGDVATTLREFYGARRYYLESLEGAVKIGAVPEVILILVKIASLLVQEQRPEEALDLLSVVLHHPATHGETRDQADGLLAQIASQVPQDVVAAHLGQATSRQFDEVVETVLAEATPPRVALR
jgi:tetratricopeptide (TPR) repeat protein